MSFNIESDGRKRVVIIGGGFAGLKLAMSLRRSGMQVVLVDKNNFHQFPPLIYQVATAGLYPSSISFPYRKIFEDRKEYAFRMAKLRSIDQENNTIQTSIGKLEYDYLVLAHGATTNYFGNENIKLGAMPMKTVAQSMGLRNALLSNFERSVTCSTVQEKEELLNVVIVGGGPSGVELAGAIAEMKNYILPKDYPDMETKRMHVYLIQADNRLLPAMSAKASAKAEKFLKKLGVDVLLYKRVVDYKDNKVFLSDGMTIPTRTFIWVCGVKAHSVKGLNPDQLGPLNRVIVDEYNRVKGSNNIFAIGDISIMLDKDGDFPKGHPMMAQPAIQQAANLAKNLKSIVKGKDNLKAFKYRDLGSMATIGRNKAVADIFGLKVSGIFAWALWMLVHLRSILGVRNKIAVLLEWSWGYFTYDRSNRMIVSATTPKVLSDREQWEQNNHLGDLKKEDVKEENIL